MMTFRFFAVALCGFASACGGSSGSGGSVSGSVHSQSYAIEESISAGVAITTQTGTQHAAVIVLSTSTGLCAEVTANTEHPNQKAVEILVFDVNSLTFNIPTVPGTYSIYQGTGTPPPKAATMSFDVDDATCASITADGAKATSGSVVLTAVSGNAFSGTYDVALDSGDHVTGSFSPDECPDLQTLVNGGSAAPVCM